MLRFCACYSPAQELSVPASLAIALLVPISLSLEVIPLPVSLVFAVSHF